eukprot:12141446-Prorocentrum_lima.AAC.1
MAVSSVSSLLSDQGCPPRPPALIARGRATHCFPGCRQRLPLLWGYLLGPLPAQEAPSPRRPSGLSAALVFDTGHL